MSIYLKRFGTTLQYETYITSEDKVLPNVSFCDDIMGVYYNPYVAPHDYSQDYLTTVALENGTISFNIWKSMGTDMITSISYSTDNGETWTTTNNVNNKGQHLTISIDVSEGDKVLWKGNAQQLGYYDEDDYGDNVGSFFSSDCEFNVQGNVMSMLYGDDFVGEETLEYDGELARLFYHYRGNACLVVSAEHMVLPATTLAQSCYEYMFYGCTSLVTAPELPATTLAYGCYYGMFSSCTNLTEAPELSATTLAQSCYSSMFEGCTNLETAPELPATTLANQCYEYMFGGCTSLTSAHELSATTLANDCYDSMFYGCTSLTSAPELPATTLASNCYRNMFNGCTSLVTAPELSATTLANQCYCAMFEGCTNLVTAPELPATTLAYGCYYGMFSSCTNLTEAPELSATTLTDSCYGQMFQGCTSLTEAPELPATTLTNWCYNSMFYGCSNLNSITCLATDISASKCTTNWVNGVAASGTFTKASSMSNWTTGANGIPNGWIVQDAA